MVDDLLFHLTGENDEPVLSLSFDRTGFHLADRWIGFLAFGHFYLDRADFRETYPVVFGQRKTRLGIGDGVIAPIALKTRVSWRFPLFHTPEKVVVGFFNPPQDILKHLRVDVVVFWPDFLDLWQSLFVNESGCIPQIFLVIL